MLAETARTRVRVILASAIPFGVVAWLTGDMIQLAARPVVLALLVVVWCFSVADAEEDRGGRRWGLSAVYVAPVAVIVGPLWAAAAVASYVICAMQRDGGRRGSMLVLVAGHMFTYLLMFAAMLVVEAGARWVVLIAAGTVYVVSEWLAETATGVAAREDLDWPESLQLLLAKMSIAAMLALISPVAPTLAIVTSALLLGLVRQSCAILRKTRMTYEATTETLVAAIEAQDPDMLGHARGAYATALELAHACGLDARTRDRIGYAALLHDLSTVAAEAEMGAPCSMRDVDYLKDAFRLLDVRHGRIPGSALSSDDKRDALVVAIACNAETEMSGRRHIEHDQSTILSQYSEMDSGALSGVLASAQMLGYPTPRVEQCHL